LLLYCQGADNAIHETTTERQRPCGRQERVTLASVAAFKNRKSHQYGSTVPLVLLVITLSEESTC